MEKITAIMNEQELDCRIRTLAYAIRLESLTPFNLLLVVGAALFALLSGSANIFQIMKC